MWLPRDERKLLACYFRDLGAPDKFKKYKNVSKRAIAANRNLNQRGLIHFQEITPDSTYKVYHEPTEGDLANLLADTEVDENPSKCFISLTLNGFDLGRKYSCWFTRTGLAYEEYKKHWIWLIVSFLLGILATLIVSWLT